MLIFSRREEESIVIGESIEITVLEITERASPRLGRPTTGHWWHRDPVWIGPGWSVEE